MVEITEDHFLHPSNRVPHFPSKPAKIQGPRIKDAKGQCLCVTGWVGEALFDPHERHLSSPEAIGPTPTHGNPAILSLSTEILFC